MNLRAIFSGIKASRINGWDFFSSESVGLVKYALDYGPFLSRDVGAGADEKYLMDFRWKIDAVLSGPAIKARCPDLKIAVEIIGNGDFNAFAAKLSLKRESYVIALFSGMLRELHQITSSATFTNIIRQAIPQLKQLSNEDISISAFYLCGSFVAYHEIGHIMRGHLNLRISEGGYPIWREDENHAASSNSALTSHVTECDADAFAGRLLLGAAAECAKVAIGAGRMPDNVATKQAFQQLACVCAGLIFLIFDKEPHSAGDRYPIASIRLAIGLGMFADQLVNEGVKDKSALDIVLQGMLAALQFAKTENWAQQDFDLAAEFKQWQDDFLPEVRKASKELHAYVPCQKK